MNITYILLYRVNNPKFDNWFTYGKYTNPVDLAEASYALGQKNYKIRIEREGDVC